MFVVVIFIDYSATPTVVLNMEMASGIEQMQSDSQICRHTRRSVSDIILFVDVN